MLKFTVGVDYVEILGPFNKKLGEAFQLGGCDRIIVIFII
jgi:hypothetical protein